MNPREAADQILSTVSAGDSPATVWVSVVGGEVSAWTTGTRPSQSWTALRRKVGPLSFPGTVANAVRRAVARAGDA